MFYSTNLRAGIFVAVILDLMVLSQAAPSGVPPTAVPESTVAVFGGRAADIGFVVFIILMTASAAVAFGGFDLRPLRSIRGTPTAVAEHTRAEATHHKGSRKKKHSSHHRTSRDRSNNEVVTTSTAANRGEAKNGYADDDDVHFNILHDVRASGGQEATSEAVNELLRVTGVHVRGDTGRGIWTVVTRRSGLRVSAVMAEDGGTALAVVVYLKASNYARIELVTSVDEKARKTLIKSTIRQLRNQKQLVHLEAIARTSEEKGFWTTEMGFHVSDAASKDQRREGVLLMETFTQSMTKLERREYNRAREVALPLAADWWKWGPVEPRREVTPDHEEIIAKHASVLTDPSTAVPETAPAQSESPKSREGTAAAERDASSIRKCSLYGPEYDGIEDCDSNAECVSWVPSLRSGDDLPMVKRHEDDWSMKTDEYSPVHIGDDEHEVSSITKEEVYDADTHSTLHSPTNSDGNTNESKRTGERQQQAAAEIVPRLNLPLVKDRSLQTTPPVSSIDNCSPDTGSSDAGQDTPVRWIPTVRSPKGPSEKEAPPLDKMSPSMDNEEWQALSPESSGEFTAKVDASMPSDTSDEEDVEQGPLSWRPSLFAGREAPADPQVRQSSAVESKIEKQTTECSSSTETPQSERNIVKKESRISTSFDWAEESAEDEDLVLDSEAAAAAVTGLTPYEGGDSDYIPERYGVGGEDPPRYNGKEQQYCGSQATDLKTGDRGSAQTYRGASGNRRRRRWAGDTTGRSARSE